MFYCPFSMFLSLFLNCLLNFLLQKLLGSLSLQYPPRRQAHLAMLKVTVTPGLQKTTRV